MPSLENLSLYKEKRKNVEIKYNKIDNIHHAFFVYAIYDKLAFFFADFNLPEKKNTTNKLAHSDCDIIKTVLDLMLQI